MAVITTAHRELLNALCQDEKIQSYDRPFQIEHMDRPGKTAYVIWLAVGD